jgi:hypothetical protein
MLRGKKKIMNFKLNTYCKRFIDSEVSDERDVKEDFSKYEDESFLNITEEILI